jgi:small neutral amino acid transporter SnatA (MarC family)
MKPQHEEFRESPAMLEELTEQFKSYASTLYELYLLKTVQKVSSGATTVLAIGIVILLAVFLLAFASIGTALWLNELLDHSSCGFFIVAGGYALLLIAMYTVRKKRIRRAIQGIIIDEMLND